ncbi:MAG TPA: 2'-5' RNA ligase family protein [Dongiaceae bacterium]
MPLEIRPALGTLTAALASEHGLTGRPRPPQNLHATLFSLGDFEIQQPELVAMARKLAAGVRARPFPVTWDRVKSLPREDRPQPLVLLGEEGVNGLAGLHESFRIPLIERGIVKPASSRFMPHVTLLYDRQTVDAQGITPVSWRVTEFVLVHSLLGQSRHIILGRWPLRG